MKKKSILEKLLSRSSKPQTNDSAVIRELLEEALEERVLNSAAPVDTQRGSREQKLTYKPKNRNGTANSR